MAGGWSAVTNSWMKGDHSVKAASEALVLPFVTRGRSPESGVWDCEAPLQRGGALWGSGGNPSASVGTSPRLVISC
jgi:hypothetical protein